MKLTKEEVLERMKDPAVVVLNVLPAEDFEKLHIKGSQNLTLGQNVRGFAMEALKKYGKQAEFITYSADASTRVDLNAAIVLQDKGMKADNYPGGVQEWFNAKFPLEGTQALLHEYPTPVLKKRR